MQRTPIREGMDSQRSNSDWKTDLKSRRDLIDALNMLSEYIKKSQNDHRDEDVFGYNSQQFSRYVAGALSVPSQTFYDQPMRTVFRTLLYWVLSETASSMQQHEHDHVCIQMALASLEHDTNPILASQHMLKINVVGNDQTRALLSQHQYNPVDGNAIRLRCKRSNCNFDIIIPQDIAMQAMVLTYPTRSAPTQRVPPLHQQVPTNPTSNMAIHSLTESKRFATHHTPPLPVLGTMVGATTDAAIRPWTPNSTMDRMASNKPFASTIACNWSNRGQRSRANMDN
jgi:hypothetical protein